MPTAGHMEQALHTMPRGLNEAFKLTIQRIKERPDGQNTLGLSTLMWLTHARRPLLAVELSEALAIDLGATSLNFRFRPSQKRMVDCCMGLVVVDDKSSIIRLVHYSVQEYLSYHQNHVFNKAESAIANGCLSYLLFTPFQKGPRQLEVHIQDLIAENVFASYAARYWGDHVRAAASEDVELRTLTFLRASPQRGCSNQIMQYTRGYRREYWKAKEVYSTNGLHIAAFFGLENMCRILLEANEVELNDTTHMGTTALIKAAGSGQQGVVRLLMSKGADFEKKNWFGTALHCAAENGSVASILELVENGVSIDIRNRRGHAPLHCATMSGHLEAIKTLLGKGAAINAIDHQRYTSLRYAIVWEQAPEIVQTLLEHNADTSIRSKRGQTPLHDAAVMNSEDALLLLLKHKADVEAKEKNGATPLHFAAEKNHLTIVRHLLNHGAEIDSRTTDGITALYFASGNGSTETTRCLLDAGANIEAADKEGLTPLVVAVMENKEPVVRLLLEAGANTEFKDEEGHNLIQTAMRGNFHAVVALLKAARTMDTSRHRTSMSETNIVNQRTGSVTDDLKTPVRCENLDSLKEDSEKLPTVSRLNEAPHENAEELLEGHIEATQKLTAKPPSDGTLHRSKYLSSSQPETSSRSNVYSDNGDRADAEAENGIHTAIDRSKAKSVRFRPRCIRCKERKLKCESSGLTCGNCEKVGRDCQYNGKTVSEQTTRKAGHAKASDGQRFVDDAHPPKQHMEEYSTWAHAVSGANDSAAITDGPIQAKLLENFEGSGEMHLLDQTLKEVGLLKDAILRYDTSMLHLSSEHDDVTRALDQCEQMKAPRLRELLASRLRTQEMKLLAINDAETLQLGTTTSEISKSVQSTVPAESLDHTGQLVILEGSSEGRNVHTGQEPPSPVPPGLSTIRSASNPGRKIYTCQETACMFTNESEDQYRQHMENAHGWERIEKRQTNKSADLVPS